MERGVLLSAIHGMGNVVQVWLYSPCIFEGKRIIALVEGTFYSWEWPAALNGGATRGMD